MRTVLLYLRCEISDIDSIKKLLANGANPDQAPFNKSRPLIMAIESGNTQVVDILLEANAESNKAYNNDNGTTPLLLAAQLGYDKIVVSLLNAKVDANKALLNGVTPLMISIIEGHASVTRLLVDILSSSDINKYYDITICDLPSEYHPKIEAFFKFLEKDVPSKLQVTPLMIALLLGKTESTECMELLINKKGVDPTLGILIDNENITPLKGSITSF